jgi:SH3-like domain-containing protein
MSVHTHLQSGLRTLLIAGATCLFLVPPAIAAEEYVSVNKDGVNVRSGPSTTSPIAMELFRGYPLKVLKKDGEWMQISDFEGDTGWIHQGLVSKNDTVIINASKSVNMRSEPSTTAAVVADVERGVIMTKISEEGQWVKLKHSSGTVGWIYKPLIWP